MEVIAAVNDEEVLRHNLAASPCIAEGRVGLRCMRGFRSAGLAYNVGLESADSELVILAHQDVYLPEGWEEDLTRVSRRLDEDDESWAVLGCVGVALNAGQEGRIVGRAWSNGLGKVVGRASAHPVRVGSLDELLIVLRACCPLRFDPRLPGFHLYGTDIVRMAVAAGRTAYACDLPVIHNSLPVRAIDRGYRSAYRYTRHKWKGGLPIATTVMPLTRGQWPLYRAWLRKARSRLLGSRATSTRHPSPAAMAKSLGFSR